MQICCYIRRWTASSKIFTMTSVDTYEKKGLSVLETYKKSAKSEVLQNAWGLYLSSLQSKVPRSDNASSTVSRTVPLILKPLHSHFLPVASKAYILTAGT